MQLIVTGRGEVGRLRPAGHVPEERVEDVFGLLTDHLGHLGQRALGEYERQLGAHRLAIADAAQHPGWPLRGQPAGRSSQRGPHGLRARLGAGPLHRYPPDHTGVGIQHHAGHQIRLTIDPYRV